MPIADAWYDRPAWGFVGVVVAVLIGTIGIWAAFRAATPKMRLRYTLRHVMPLMTVRRAEPDDDSLVVMLDGAKLQDPYVTTVVLAADGRQDIPEDAFSKQRPLVLDLGVPVKDVLSVTYEPGDAPMPDVVAEGSTLEIGPDLLHRGSVLTVAVLVDGGEPVLQPPSRILVDVRLQHGEPSAPIPVLNALIGTAWALWLAGTTYRWPGFPADTGPGTMILLAATGLVMLVRSLLPRIAAALTPQPTSQDE